MSELPATSWVLRLKGWAEREENVRLALLVGSQARTERPADPQSDIDLVLFARDPDRILHGEDWLADLGPYWTSHVEANALHSGEERRVLFEDGQDVDFAVFPAKYLGALVTDLHAAGVLRRGFRVLADKDAIRLAVPPAEQPPVSPSPSEFSNLENDYWFHLVWAAKKLRRGELMTALEVANGYLPRLLVRAVRWHGLACGPSGRDLWHGARFLESWADPRVMRDLPATVAQYDSRSIAQALRASRALFSWLSEETRQHLAFPSTIRDPAQLSRYLDRLLDKASP